MAMRNDGGDFSNDPFAKLIAQKMGSMSENDLAQQEQVSPEAIEMAMGMMGTVAPVSKFAGVSKALGQVAPELSMADKIRQAAQNGSVKTIGGPLVEHNIVLSAPERAAQFGKVIGPEGGITNNASMYQKGAPVADYWSNLKKSMSK